MYARELLSWLHERLAERGTLEQTQTRFERLRGDMPFSPEGAGMLA
jgi:hypothetical protein